MASYTLRDEQPADLATIRTVIETAFEGKPYAGGDEQDVVDRLRDAGALTVALVALADEEIVGHIAFSPTVAADGSAPWFALGPVAVRPAYQGKGIGALLINAGLQRLTEQGALGCMLTGNPDYYSRFGFELRAANCPAAEPAEYFQMKLLGGDYPSGPLTFHPAFYDG